LAAQLLRNVLAEQLAREMVKLLDGIPLLLRSDTTHTHTHYQRVGNTEYVLYSGILYITRTPHCCPGSLTLSVCLCLSLCLSVSLFISCLIL